MTSDIVVDLNLIEAMFIAGVAGFGIGAGIIALKVAIDWVRTREVDKKTKTTTGAPVAADESTSTDSEAGDGMDGGGFD